MDCVHLILEILTAVGTIGATIVALWLARRDDRPRINGVFVWSASTEYQPTLMIQNIGKQIAVIELIEVFYHGHLVCRICFSEEYTLRNFSIVEAGEVKRVPLKTEWLHMNAPQDKTRPFTLKVVIRPRSGRKSVSKQKYSYNELCGLFFGYGLFSNKS